MLSQYKTQPQLYQWKRQKVITGCIYTNMQGAKKKKKQWCGRHRWRRLFSSPWAIDPWGAQDDHIWDHQKEEVQQADEPTVGSNEENKIWVSMQTSFSKGFKSHIEWSMILGPQKGSQTVNRIWMAAWTKAPAQAPPTRRLHICWLILVV